MNDWPSRLDSKTGAMLGVPPRSAAAPVRGISVLRHLSLFTLSCLLAVAIGGCGPPAPRVIDMSGPPGPRSDPFVTEGIIPDLSDAPDPPHGSLDGAPEGILRYRGERIESVELAVQDVLEISLAVEEPATLLARVSWSGDMGVEGTPAWRMSIAVGAALERRPPGFGAIGPRHRGVVLHHRAGRTVRG